MNKKNQKNKELPKNNSSVTVFRDEGEIVSLSDGIAWISGLEDAMYGELINFKNNISGLVFNLEEDRVGVVVLGDFENLKLKDKAISSSKLLEIGVGDKILGRVINPLGMPLDDMPDYKVSSTLPIERIAPGIIDRKPVSIPLQTGIKAIDSMIPIGRGQRELIIGDRGTGKSALAIDTIINQKDTDVIPIYVSIGQKRAKTALVIDKLKEFGVLEKSVLVVASASDTAALRYLAPYVGCAIGEYFMEKGKHALLIYDDLSKHAWAYRELSLLLKRPSGREAYPGDVFYLHSRLLERACQLSDERGGGSLTALPIIETQAQDISAYIPTNVISITDGQIYLEPDLFFAGIRPALNVGLSVSRVGGSAQVKAMKKVAGKLRLDLTQYYELATFAQFATELDPATKLKIDRGKRIVEILKQNQYLPQSVEDQVMVIYLVTSGALDEIPLNLIKTFEKEFMEYLYSHEKKLITGIAEKKEFSEETKKKTKEIIEKFKKDFMRSNSLQGGENGKSKIN